MQILIVDDQPKRYDLFIAELKAMGIDRGSVDIVTSCNDARARLMGQEYDLLLLDILVPLHPEDSENPQNAIDLLFEIRQNDLTSKAPYILGITADRAAAGSALAQFEDWCWTVLNYSRSTDEWMHRALNCVTFIRGRGKKPENSNLGTEVVIICALEDPELSEVLKLPWNWQTSRPLDDTIFIHDGKFVVDDKSYNVCAVCLPRMGMVASAIAANTLISTLRPKLIAMTGICAGVRGKVKLGDVLFADPAWDFQSGKWDGETGRFLFRPHHIPAPAKVRNHILQLRGDSSALEAIRLEFEGTKPDTSRIVLGPLASGSAVLSDGRIIQGVKGQHQELIGVEMEIYGIYAAAHAASSPQPAFLAVKGVCDFADPDKAEGYQRYAAYSSAQVLRLLLERYGNRLI
ncbi:hypothetical protein [Agrobacterium rosae]|uniref:Response regulatory domain-containing protein n=1 Tax=Agrobacterium rosae TaxID=1972867 RepID=A0AAW9FDC7_9HYPH|nr:hypothetical protein [Agrobacterium rosae]MDX8304652.1 hypothetical protein [Agrobacterium rosae]